MDKYTAKNAVTNLYKYFEDLTAIQPVLYQKSKQDYMEMYEMLSQIIKMVGNIVEMDQLRTDTDEFESGVAEFKRDIVSDVIRQLANVGGNTIDMPANYNSEYSPQNPEILSTPLEDLTPADCKQIVKRYSNLLQAISNADCEYQKVNQCADIIWKWYQARILKKYPNAPQFNYCIHRLKGIIYSIVLVFGKHQEQGKVDTFLNHFEEWIRNLSISPKSNTWIAPYEVYEVERACAEGRLDKEYGTLSAVVIWDILLDNGLRELCETAEHNDVYPQEYQIWDRVEKVNVDALDAYVKYTSDRTIIESLNL